MIALVEGANRQKTPNEIALNILLAALTIIFLLAVATLQPLAIFSKAVSRRSRRTRLALNARRRHRHRAGLAAGLPDPDHDRRAAVGDRHRRHGPAGAAQRAGDVRPRGRGGRRRQHPAAGQDRHHHPGQPAGQRVPARSTASTADDAGRRGAAVQPGRRDARRAARSWSTPRPRTGCGSASPASWATRPGCRSPRRPGCPVWTWPTGRRRAQVRKGAATAVMKWVRDNGGHPSERGRPDGRRHLRLRRHPAASSPSTSTGSRPGRSASSTSRTSSSRACGSASTRCAGWASAP